MDRCPHPTCQRDFPQHCDRCPHCGRDVGFPNVRQCARSEETTALEVRYLTALDSAKRRSCEAQVREFEQMVSQQSRAVLNRSVHESLRLATDGLELYANYYRVADAEIRLPKGSEWDRWRRVAEEAVLPGYKERICFAALSLDGGGLSHYGPCTWICKTSQIEHRATVFEQNCVVFMWPRSFKDAARIPEGYRATWQTRGKLAAAKLASRISLSTTQDLFGSLLLSPDPRGKGEKDEFIEVHIYGPLSVHSLEDVTLRQAGALSKTEARVLQNKLAKQGITLRIL
jgi:hypothetical protein